MALRKFTPDLDLYDPDDAEGWIGTWEHDDGSSLYGQGDPDMGRELLAANEVPLEPEGDAPPAPGQQALGANAPRSDFQNPYQSPMTPAPARVPHSSPAPTAPVDTGMGWEDDVPPQVASALTQQASAAGLNPAHLAATIRKESGWNPSIGSAGDAGKDAHAGLIQFSRNLWPGVAQAAGRPEVTWDEMRSMSAEDQIPFVVAYYKGKGLTPESSPGDYKLATYKPKHLAEGDEFVTDDAANPHGIPATPKNERLDANGDGIINSYEQNRGLDTNKDGKITAGEVRGNAPGAPLAGARPALSAPAPAVGQPGAAEPYPSTFQGMPAAQAAMRGVPLAPGQIEQRQQDVAQRYAAQAQVQQAAAAARVQGRTEVMNEWTRQHQQQQTDAKAEEQKQASIAQEAQAKIDREVNQPIQKVNPKRYVQGMSTGEKIFGAIAIIADALGQAAHASIGINRPNVAVQFLQQAIEDDITQQKDEIEQGRAQSQNRVQHWTRVLGSAEMGERAARAESKQAAGGLLQAKAMQTDIADLQAAQMQQAGALFAEAQNEINGIVDKERERLTIQYETPKPTAAGPDKMLERIRALKETEQELKASGMSDGEIDAFFKANGLARLGGETVPQQTARHGVERAADEETSKELEPVAIAENGWRKAQTALDALTKHALTSEGYTHPDDIVGSNWFPGVPTVSEINAYNQAITDAVNASIRAEKGSQTPEDVERVRAAIVGTGSIEDIRRGIQAQLEKLELQRQSVSARRAGSASRVQSRQEAETMPRVSGKVYIPGAGPLR
jgi:hypothetical protein